VARGPPSAPKKSHRKVLVKKGIGSQGEKGVLESKPGMPCYSRERDLFHRNRSRLMCHPHEFSSRGDYLQKGSPHKKKEVRKKREVSWAETVTVYGPDTWGCKGWGGGPPIVVYHFRSPERESASFKGGQGKMVLRGRRDRGGTRGRGG